MRTYHLLEKCLLNKAYLEDEARILCLRNCLEGQDPDTP